MTDDLKIYDNVEALERFVGLPKGALTNIPIYARKGAVDAIIKVRQMESESLFRPGLYYIVLADLRKNTAFNAKYGDAEGDVRVEWFQTCVVQSLGEIPHRNYAAYVKAVGDAALLVFSSFEDVVAWSDKLTINLASMTDEYIENLTDRGVEFEGDELDQRLADFAMSARRLVHLGEVRYKNDADPICLAVSQTFKAEKHFDSDDLGCTSAVWSAVRPLLDGLNRKAVENAPIQIVGHDTATMSYYVVQKSR